MSNVKIISVPGFLPPATSFGDNEIIINVIDGKLYIKNTQNNTLRVINQDSDKNTPLDGDVLINKKIEFKEKKDSDSILFISSSGKQSKIGVGTSNPLTSLDIRSSTGSIPANIILRTNEDGVITPGEETGRIIFAIESSSYNFGNGFDFIKSGSTAAIYSKVINSGSGPTEGTHGSLVFEISKGDARLEPINILTLGHGFSSDDLERGGIYTSTNRAIAMFSASLILDGEDGPYIHLRGGTNTGNPYRIADLGVTIENVTEFLTAQSDNYDRGSLKLFHNSSSKVDLNSYGTYDYIHTGKRLGIGTNTPGEKLEVIGNISASGDIIGYNVSASGDIIGNINGGTF
jgi:hypothetical protein